MIPRGLLRLMEPLVTVGACDPTALLSSCAAIAAEWLSLRLFRHSASSVRHRRYHGAGVITVRADRDGEGGVPRAAPIASRRRR